MLIDSHSHLNFNAFDNDYDEVIKKCLSEDIWMINVGSKYSTSQKAVEIALKYDNIYAAIGLHPIHAKEEEFDKDKYLELAKIEKVKAIGEIGLDYFRDYGEFKDKQKDIFTKQLDLAKELDLPVIIHCRKAHDDVLEILKNYNLRGVIHCFTGTWKQAQKYLDLGFYLGINGIMYKLDLKEVIEKAPLNKILLETDCPYLGKEERNEPTFVRQIAKEIARIKAISFEEVAENTSQNTKILFML
jgi:TatD DNase family protein